MIAALDNFGQIWFSLGHAATDGDVITLFLMNMVKILDNEDPNWRDNTIFLWDNAPYHTSVETKKIIHRLGLQIIFSGPYSFSAAPIETLFSGLKFGELNTEDSSTGKR